MASLPTGGVGLPPEDTPPPTTPPPPPAPTQWPDPPKGDVTVRFTNYVNAHDFIDINTGADQITWNYGLNVKSYPTYGGEVVQILSAYIDDFTITGTVASYAMMEHIYKFFLRIMQTETAGGAKGPSPYQAEGPFSFNSTAYNILPVQFSYPQRGWKFDLIPKSLPQFHYGTEVIAPTWQMTAAVFQAERAFTDLLIERGTNIIAGNILQGDDVPALQAIGTFKSNVTADIGYDPNNKYQVPTDKSGKAIGTPSTSGLPSDVQGIVDFFNNTVLSAYLNNSGDISTLVPSYSKPPAPKASAKSTKTAGATP